MVIRKKALANLFILMEIHMRDIGIMIKDKKKEFINVQIWNTMKGNMKMI
jgi:hypothetical protein